jgi:hypothetical protein
LIGAIGSFDVVDISDLSRSAELPIWFTIHRTLNNWYVI